MISERFLALPTRQRLLVGAIVVLVVIGSLWALYGLGAGLLSSHRDAAAAARAAEYESKVDALRSEVDQLRGADAELVRRLDEVTKARAEAEAERETARQETEKTDARTQTSRKTYRDARTGRAAGPRPTGDALLRELQEFRNQGTERP